MASASDTRLTTEQVIESTFADEDSEKEDFESLNESSEVVESEIDDYATPAPAVKRCRTRREKRPQLLRQLALTIQQKAKNKMENGNESRWEEQDINQPFHHSAISNANSQIQAKVPGNPNSFDFFSLYFDGDF